MGGLSVVLRDSSVILRLCKYAIFTVIGGRHILSRVLEKLLSNDSNAREHERMKHSTPSGLITDH